MARQGQPTVAFMVSHPHDVHLFRNAIEELSRAGYEVHVFVREKEMTTQLLENYGISHRVLASENETKLGLARSWSSFAVNLYRAARRVEPDLMVAEVGAATTPVAWLLGVESLVFMDAEHARLQNSVVFPLASRICTSTCFWTDVGPKQVRYEGYQELAYLHPDRFEPDPTVRAEAGLGPDEDFVVLRTVGWNAAHDVGAGGFETIESVIEELESEGVTVLVTSEEPLPEHLRSYRLSIEPHRIHHLLYYASLYVGESATMATESAVLGTPAVYVSTLEVGYATEIERDYGLLFQHAGPDRHERGIERARAILGGGHDADWEARWRWLIADKCDTTAVIVDQVRDMTEEPTVTEHDRPTVREE